MIVYETWPHLIKLHSYQHSAEDILAFYLCIGDKKTFHLTNLHDISVLLILHVDEF